MLGHSIGTPYATHTSNTPTNQPGPLLRPPAHRTQPLHPHPNHRVELRQLSAKAAAAAAAATLFLSNHQNAADAFLGPAATRLSFVGGSAGSAPQTTAAAVSAPACRASSALAAASAGDAHFYGHGDPDHVPSILQNITAQRYLGEGWETIRAWGGHVVEGVVRGKGGSAVVCAMFECQSVLESYFLLARPDETRAEDGETTADTARMSLLFTSAVLRMHCQSSDGTSRQHPTFSPTLEGLSIVQGCFFGAIAPTHPHTCLYQMRVCL